MYSFLNNNTYLYCSAKMLYFNRPETADYIFLFNANSDQNISKYLFSNFMNKLFEFDLNTKEILSIMWYGGGGGGGV